MAILRGRERKLMWRQITTGGGRSVRHKIPFGILRFLVNKNMLSVNHQTEGVGSAKYLIK